MLSSAGFGIMPVMDKSKIVRSWAALGPARPGFDEYERAMTRPMRMTPCGSVSAVEICDWVFREENCWAYFKLKIGRAHV